MQVHGVTRTEQVLWERWCNSRDQRAFRALIAAHEAFVYDFARRLTGHSADAEDLAQEAFLELAEADRERPSAVGVRAFLGRHISLGARMLKRASLTRQRLEPKAVEPAPVHPEHAVENRDAAEAALAELDPESRQVLVLRFLHGLSYAEVAHVLGVNEGAARVRVHRGLGKLKERFGSEAKASAGVAGLVLFLPGKSFAASTTKAAVLLGGALVMSTAKKLGIVAVILLLFGSGAALWHSSRGDEVAPARVAPGSRLDPGTSSGRSSGAALNDASTSEAERPGNSAQDAVVATAPIDAPIPKGRGSVVGTLRFRDGSPAVGYSVSLSGSPAKIDTTNAQGRFHLHDEWVDQRDLCLRGPRGFSMGVATVSMKEDERVEIEVVLERGHTFTAEFVREDDGAPVVDAHVRLYFEGEGQKQARWGWGDLGADGRMVFPHVPVGSYRLQIVKCPGLEASSRTIEITGDQSLIVKVKTARVVHLKFENMPAAFRGSTVMVMFESLAGPSFSIDSVAARLSEEDGMRLDAPPHGRYQVTLSPMRSKMPRLNLGEYVVSSKDPEPIVHRFPMGASVVGTVLRPDGKPLANTSVRLEQARVYAKTDESGKFEIPFARAGTSRIVLILRNGSSIVVGSVVVPESGAVRADVRIRGTATITGEFDRNATRWGGAVELFRKGEDRATATWRFGVDRSIRFEYVEAGDYELRTWAVNAVQSSRALFVEKGARIDLGEIEVARHAEYPIRITAPTGRDVPRSFPVMFRSGSKVQSAKVTLTADGDAVLTGVPEGPGKLWFKLNGCKGVSVDVDLRAGMDPVVIALEAAPVTIEVPVRLKVGEGVEIPDYLQVRAQGRNGSVDASAFLMFPRRGVFGRLQNLVRGSYTLHIQHAGWKSQVVDVEIRSGDQEPIRISVERGE